MPVPEPEPTHPKSTHIADPEQPEEMPGVEPTSGSTPTPKAKFLSGLLPELWLGFCLGLYLRQRVILCLRIYLLFGLTSNWHEKPGNLFLVTCLNPRAQDFCGWRSGVAPLEEGSVRLTSTCLMRTVCSWARRSTSILGSALADSKWITRTTFLGSCEPRPHATAPYALPQKGAVNAKTFLLKLNDFKSLVFYLLSIYF